MPWAQGTDRDWLQQLLCYWADRFDGRPVERELNRFAHYRARIGPAEIHFVRRSNAASATSSSVAPSPPVMTSANRSTRAPSTSPRSGSGSGTPFHDPRNTL